MSSGMTIFDPLAICGVSFDLVCVFHLLWSLGLQTKNAPNLIRTQNAPSTVVVRFFFDVLSQDALYRKSPTPIFRKSAQTLFIAFASFLHAVSMCSRP